ncbi:MAG: hypothetical protein KF744_06005 [Taibaiella sp.]|nr:hypothetical protein [Taibaiella sp.]
MNNIMMQQEIPARPDIPEVKPHAPEQPVRTVPQPEIKPGPDPKPSTPPPEAPPLPNQ